MSWLIPIVSVYKILRLLLVSVAEQVSTNCTCSHNSNDLSVVSYSRKYWYVHKVQVNHLGDLSLPRNSVSRLTDQLHMTLTVLNGP